MLVLCSHRFLPNILSVWIDTCSKDGARVTTRIKKVDGDREAFVEELRAVLQIPLPSNPKDETLRIRTGGTIEVKGNRVREVKQWLAGLGF